MTTNIIICLTLFVLMMGMLAWNRYPMGVIGLAALTLLVLTGVLPPKAALTNFGNANVVIIMGMFIVGAGLKKTSLIGHLTLSIRKATGGNFQMAYRSVILLAVLLTSILTSPAVCYAIVFPIMDSICEEFHVSKSKVQFPLCLICITCAGILPFGFAISEAAVFNGLMETYGYQMNFTALDFTLGRFPIMVLVIVWALFFAQKVTLSEPAVEIISNQEEKHKGTELSQMQNILGAIIFIFTIGALIFGAKLKLTAWVVVLTGSLLFILTDVLSFKEAVTAMPFDIGFMFIGANAMADALVRSGTADAVGKLISGSLGGKPNNLLLCLIFFLVPFILTQFMNNQAVMNIFAPICLLICKPLGADPRGLLILICAGSLTAFMTPSATAAIPMMMAAGGYDVKSLVKMGWMFAILISICYIGYISLFMPAV